MTSAPGPAHRLCPNDGSPLQRVAGAWALPQLQPSAQAPQLPAHMQEVVYGCLLYRCAVCRHLELVDTD